MPEFFCLVNKTDFRQEFHKIFSKACFVLSLEPIDDRRGNSMHEELRHKTSVIVI